MCSLNPTAYLAFIPKAVFTSALKICNSPAAGERVYHLALCPENKMLQKGHRKKKVSWGEKEKKNPSLSRLIEWKVNFHRMPSLCESCTALNMWRGQLTGAHGLGCGLGTQCSPELALSPWDPWRASPPWRSRWECADTQSLHTEPRPPQDTKK